MKAKLICVFIACVAVTLGFAQKSINNYKYVIVPKKYDFLKEKDQYQLNSLTQFLFNKYGFEAIMEGAEYPKDLNVNRCLAMKSDVIKESGVFSTKLKVLLKDCNEKEIFQTAVGDSREKEFKVAYNLALRDAFKSFETVNYSYEPNDDILALGSTAVVAKTESEEIKQLKQQIKELEATKTNQSPDNKTSMAVTAIPVAVATENTKVAHVNSETNQAEVKTGLTGVLYAQQIENGYQLVDSSPKVVYKVRNTNLENVFLVEDKSAIVFKKGDVWVMEFYENNVLKQEALNIKF